MINLFVRNLSWDANEEDLRDAFERQGLLVSRCKVPIDRESGNHKGYGFVEVENLETLEAAQDVMDGYELRGRPIYLALATPQGPKPPRDGERAPVRNRAPSHSPHANRPPERRDDYSESWKRR